MSRYYSKAELENSPSRRLGLDTKKETLFRWAACDLIKECGQRLKIPQLTIATATVFCHRFYAVHPHDSGENEWKTVAPACLFLAGKVEETPKALRDVVCVAYLWCHRKEQEAATERLKDKEVINEVGEKILAAERKLLHTLGFEFSVQHPYIPLSLAIKKMRSSQPSKEEQDRTRELFQVAWNFINDSLRTTLSLQYDAKAIAAAAMYLAARFKAAKLPDMGDGGAGAEWWYTTFATPPSPAVAEDIGNQILDLYQQSGKSMLADAGLQATTTTTMTGAAAAAPAAPNGGASAVGHLPPPQSAPAGVASHHGHGAHVQAPPVGELRSSGVAVSRAAAEAALAPHGALPGGPHHRSDGSQPPGSAQRVDRDRERDREREQREHHRDRDRDRDRDHRDRHHHHHHHHGGGGGGGGGGQPHRVRSRSRSPRRESDDRRRDGGGDGRGEPYHHRDSHGRGGEYHQRPSGGPPPPPERRVSEKESLRLAAEAARQH